ncbi:hypothetical protein [Streptomyces sp. NPDC086023]|uniref:hypothetical protein n=1 Tax=Streptomyces sp. NPDC086023 TaxID=3365746 RepID=UPI0037D425CC
MNHRIRTTRTGGPGPAGRTTARRRLAAVLGAGALAASLVAGTAAAQDAPAAKPAPAAPAGATTGHTGPVPGGFASWADLMALQKKLDAAADRITATRAEGYAGIVTAPENRELRLYWKGTLPAPVRSLVADIRRSVPVRVLPAAHTERALQAEAARLIRQPGVLSAAPDADGSGLTVATAGTAAADGLTASVPLRRTAERPAPVSRGADTSPYWGGARWNGCSTGFAVITGTGTSAMLSAGHCADNGATARTGGGITMGPVSGTDKTRDTLLINATSAGRIYDGGVGTGEFSKPVAGARRSYTGDWLCDSGAYSGAVCNIQVKATGQWINIGYSVGPVVRAEQVDHVAPVGNGDSGGPVFELDWPDHPERVIAKGTNTAIDLNTQAACQGVPESTSRRCAWRFYYADVIGALTSYGARIATG